jgi:hypothetical protein
MSSGTTSAFREFSSRKVKQQVVRLLFGKQYARKGPDAHRKLDASIYTFADLKKAYLGRIQEIHPDKIRIDSTVNVVELKQEFNALQEAWGKYEALAKSMKNVGNGSEEANFTMFGVGCSFADTEAERDLRNEITEQACRGWFSSGLLAETTESSRNGTAPAFKLKPVSLLDKNLFSDSTKNVESLSMAKETSTGKTKPKTLIPGLR